jgi:outer membrane receptor protein involved in Fe transport
MDTLTSLLQEGATAVKRQGYQTGLTFDWDLSAKDRLTAGFTFEHFDNHTHLTAAQTQQTTDAQGDVLSSLQSQRISSSRYRSNTADYSLDYKHSFHRKGTELEFLASYSAGRNFTDYQQQQSYPGSALPNSGSVGNSPGTDYETDLSLDYKNAVSENFTIETGAKTVLEALNTNTVTDTLQPDGSYVNNTSQTYGFIYNRQVYAGYVSAEFSLFKKFLQGQAGIRYEYTHTAADFKGAAIPSYGLFFPSLVLSHSFNDDESLKIAYSHRIERPDYGDLNPFYNIGDPHNISAGNPGLRPEKGYRYELGYNHKISGGSLYVGGFYRRNTDDIQAVSTYYATLDIGGVSYTDVTLSQRYNIGSQSSIGANIFGSLAITNAFSLRTNIQVGSMTNESAGLGKSTGFLFRGNLNASYAFSSDFIAELFGNLHSATKTIQGTRPVFGFYTLAVRKQFWKKKASIGLTATNPFNKYIDQRTVLYGSNFTQNQLRRVPYQSFGITLSYKFGKLDFKPKEHDENDQAMPVE